MEKTLATERTEKKWIPAFAGMTEKEARMMYKKDSGQAGMTLAFLLSAWSATWHMNRQTSAWSFTFPLVTTANKSPCPLVRKGVKGDLGGAGDRIGIICIGVKGAAPPCK
jgi:hypothetical protein